MDIDLTDNSCASLIPYPIEHLTKPIRLAESEISIGRASSNTIQLTGEGISRSHARISFENGQYILTDLGSSNGTFVNKKRINQVVLNHNDKILFSKREFVFFIDCAYQENKSTEFHSEFGDAVTISEKELDLSKLLTPKADTAANNFFKPSSVGKKRTKFTALAHKRLSYLYQLSEKLRLATDPAEILSQGLKLIFRALPSAQRGVAMLRSNMTGALEARAVKYRSPDPDKCTIPITRTVLDQVLEKRVAIVSRNIQDDPRFDHSDSIIIHKIKSIICVPLQSRSKVIGAVHVDTDDFLNPFTQNDMEFTAAVSKELALSIENCHLQKQAIKNERMAAIGLTITNLGHNIKNLLNLNANFVRLMDNQLEAIKDEEIQKCWQSVRENLDNISNLTADMLEYTEIDAQEPQRIDINAAILAECEVFKENLAREGIELELNLAPGLPQQKMNEIRLRRAILNLVVNAKDALKHVENGRIKISTELDDQRCLFIRVSDNGCGISKEKLNKIFEIFYTTKGMDGSGLGLSIVQKFAESLGGKISVVSQVGIGSIFSMAFPEAH